MPGILSKSDKDINTYFITNICKSLSLAEIVEYIEETLPLNFSKKRLLCLIKYVYYHQTLYYDNFHFTFKKIKDIREFMFINLQERLNELEEQLDDLKNNLELTITIEDKDSNQ